jgi:hypothetical protein
MLQSLTNTLPNRFVHQQWHVAGLLYVCKGCYGRLFAVSTFPIGAGMCEICMFQHIAENADFSFCTYVPDTTPFDKVETAF